MPNRRIGQRRVLCRNQNMVSEAFGVAATSLAVLGFVLNWFRAR
jgi:hypothetical protein